MKLFQIVIRARVNNRAVQSLEVWSDNQRNALNAIMTHYPNYRDARSYSYNVRVLRESFTRMNKLRRHK